MHHAGIDFAVDRDAAGGVGGRIRGWVVIAVRAAAQHECDGDPKKVKVFHSLPFGVKTNGNTRAAA